MKKLARYFQRVLILCCVTLSVCQAQVPANLLCNWITGQVPEKYGPGDCAGNNFRTYDLSYVYPGLALHYNSQAAEHNVLGLGKRITLGDVSFVDLDAVKPFFWAGDGTVLDLEYRTTGGLANSYVAKNRNLLSDYFKKDSATQVTQYAMDGTVYKYTLVSGTRYKLGSIITRTGATSEIAVGSGTEQYLKFVTSKIMFTKQGTNIIVSNTGDSTRNVTLSYDNLARLTTISYLDGTKYQLAYNGNTSLLLSETLVTSSGSEATGFVYDNLGRVINLNLPNNTSVRFVRNVKDKYSKGIYPNGQVQQIFYDNNGFMKRAVTYIINNPEQIVEEVEYVFDATGRLLSTTYPQGADTTKIENQYYPQDPRMPVGYKKFKNGVLIESKEELRSLYTWLSSLDTVKDGSGKILSQVQYVYPPALPFIPTSIVVKEGPGKGSKEDYKFEGARTTIISYDQNLIKTSTRVYEKDLIKVETNHLAPSSKQLKEYAYDTEGRVNSIKVGGKEIAKYGFNAKGSQNYFKDENGDEHTTYYDYRDFVEKEEHKLPGGMVTVIYQREFYPETGVVGDKLKSLQVKTVYPNESKYETTEYDLEGNVTERTVNGVVVE